MVGRAYSIPTVALRFFNVYGPRQALSNPYTGVLAIFAARLLNDKRAARLRGRPAAARLRQRPRRRARVPARARDDGGGRRRVQHRQRPARSRSARSPSAWRDVLGKRDLAPEITGKYRVGDIRHCFADIALARGACSAIEPQVELDDGLAELAALARGRRIADDRSSAMRARSSRARAGG